MQWASESRGAKRKRMSNWHERFAWFPVRIGEKKFWLQTVWRKKTYYFLSSDCVFKTEYEEKVS